MQGERPEETLIVVAHGTVISLYVASVTSVDPYQLWKRLGLPSFVALNRADVTVKTIVESIE